MFTRFFDMCSGGGRKTEYDVIVINAREDRAITEFKRVFDRDPYHVTCSCCGDDFSVWECDTLEDAVAGGTRVLYLNVAR